MGWFSGCVISPSKLQILAGCVEWMAQGTGDEKKGLKTRVRRGCVAEVVVAVSLVVSTNEGGCTEENDIVHLQASHI